MVLESEISQVVYRVRGILPKTRTVEAGVNVRRQTMGRNQDKPVPKVWEGGYTRTGSHARTPTRVVD